MFAPTRYLEWARRYYGRVRFDLATSGMPTAPIESIGVIEPARMNDPGGWDRLRNVIARYNDVRRDEAVAALGTTHALWLAYASLTSPGDDVLVEEPAYEPLVRIAEGVGARVVRFARPAEDRFALDPDRLARAMTPRTRLVVVTNLHNPSGVRMPDAVLRAAARIAQQRGAYLLVDEVYAPFDGLVDERGVFGGTARKLAPNVVAVGSLTKCFGVGPLRVGWLLGPQDVVARAQDAITASCGMLPLTHAHLAAHALVRVPELAARTRAMLAGKRQRVAAWAAAEGLAWSAPDEGLFGFAAIPMAGDLTPVVEAAAREREVLVAPGSFFEMPNGFRLAWSAESGALDEGLARLALALRAARHRGR